MKVAGWSIVGLSFAGSAAACVMAGASYPIAIWAVVFGVGYKALHQESAYVCPLATVAAAQEDGDGHVVAKVAAKRRQD